MDWRYLFTPLDIGPVTVKNRLGFAPNCPVTGGDIAKGLFDDDSVYYYAERAKGGQGLIVIGNTRVAEVSPHYPFVDPQLFDDGNIPWLKKIAREVHRYDTRLFIQLAYTMTGRTMEAQQNALYSGPEVDLTHPGPSYLSNVSVPGVSLREIGADEVPRIAEEWAKAAARAVEGGLDGVEIAANHQMMPALFLNPRFNKRTDRYGGSMENRSRFLIEVLQRVRKEVGDGVALGYRISGDSLAPGGPTVDDVRETVKYVNSQVTVDYVDVSIGGTMHSIHETRPVPYGAAGYQMPYTALIKEAVDVPVFGVGSISDPHQAEDALAKGQCDVVLMARQLFADPEFANKAREGRPDDVRPCVQANFCIGRGGRMLRPSCFQNPAHGREKVWGMGTMKQAARRKGVMVIGGGPAGLEVARVAAARGHHVVLYEKEQRLGGRLRLQARLPHQYEWGKRTAWCENQLRRAGAQVLLDLEVTPDTVDAILEEQGPDEVVVATGSRSARDGFNSFLGGPIKGWDNGNVYTYEDVMDGRAPEGGVVIILDDFSNELAPGLALLLAPKAKEVQIVTRWPTLVSEPYSTVNRGGHMERLFQHKNIRIVPHTFVKEIGDGSVTLMNTYTMDEQEEEGVDGVVLLTHFQPDNELYSLVESRVAGAHLIGDAVVHRPVHDAIFEGHRLGRTL